MALKIIRVMNSGFCKFSAYTHPICSFFPEGLFQTRPLPDAPGGLDSLGSKWMSKENLLANQGEDDPNLFVALYEFQSGGDNQLSIIKGKSSPPG